MESIQAFLEGLKPSPEKALVEQAISKATKK
jgi:hypothetical protein